MISGGRLNRAGYNCVPSVEVSVARRTRLGCFCIYCILNTVNRPFLIKLVAVGVGSFFFSFFKEKKKRYCPVWAIRLFSKPQFGQYVRGCIFF